MVNVFTKIPVFVREVKIELAKVSWTSRKDLFGATWIVMMVTAILTAYIGVLDFFLSKAVSLVLK
ncbi:MAG: preprotein translocase subunit SecE [Candidatus Omnitrophica bacterium]|nr:preprotein translocase subunit SecE [Candidatus Omnitrophota bacterium]